VSTAAEPVAQPPATAPESDLGRRDYVRAVRRTALLVVGVGVVARVVRYALGASLWGDEAAVALNLARRDWVGLTHTLDWFQVAPVLFLWAERAAVLVLGGSEWSLRLLPFVAGVAGLFAFRDLARRVVPPTAAALATALLAVSHWPIFLSGTLKPYTCDLFWSAGLMALAVRWRQRPHRLWPLAALALAVPLALGLSFPTVFVAGGVTLYLLPAVVRQRDRRAAALFALYNLLLVGSFAAVFLLSLRQQADPNAAELQAFMRNYWTHGFPPDTPLRLIVWAVRVHTGWLMMYPVGDANGGSTLTFLLFVGGVWACWRSRDRALLVLCLAPFALNFAAAAIGKYPYGASCRLCQHLAPAICLLVGVGWAAILERIAPRLADRLWWVRAAAVALAGFGVAHIAVDLHRPHRDTRAKWSQAVSREVGYHLRPGDVVVYRCAAAVRYEPFEWYMVRLGGRVAWDDVPAVGPDVRRVWVVAFAANGTGAADEAEVLTRLGPAWETLARTEYQLRPDGWEHNYLHAAVRCLGRTGDPAPRPVLAASPP
jgi:hypothetical protein